MIIREIHIRHYGMFEDARMQFNPGINLIYGGNETGKSTIVSFIHAMLFGLEPARGRSHTDEYRLRQPWENGSFYAGTMRVEKDGKIYRIERNFYRHEKSLAVIDESAGEALADPQEMLRTLLGGMSESAFDHTLWMRQGQYGSDKRMLGEIREALAGMRRSGDMTVDTQKALSLLENRKKEVLRRQRSQISQLDEQIEVRLKEQQLLRRLESEQADQVPGPDASDRNDEKAEWEIPYPEQVCEPENKTEAGNKQHPWEGILLQILLAAACLLLAAAAVVIAEGIVRVALLSISGIGMLGLLLFRGVRMQTVREKRNGNGAAERIQSGIKTIPKEDTALMQVRRKTRDRLAALEEEIEQLGRKRDQIHGDTIESEALELAASRIRELAGRRSGQVWEEYAGRVSAMLDQLTGGEYTAVSVDDQMHVRLNTPDRLIEPEQLSRGTLCVLSFALRMAAASMLAADEVPAVLDEPFAMYDNDRLAAVIKWLDHSSRQIILFSCQTREKQALDVSRRNA